jgi:hypothetical protein
VGSPQRYPEWWPRVVEVRGERFEEGDEFVQLMREPIGQAESSFLLERREDLREIRMRCQSTGMYAHWLLTPAQGGTFVELEMGMDPLALHYKILDKTVGMLYFRRWTEASIEGLQEAAQAPTA